MSTHTRYHKRQFTTSTANQNASNNNNPNPNMDYNFMNANIDDINSLDDETPDAPIRKFPSPPPPQGPPPNLDQWNANAAYWDETLQSEGNSMFTELILPNIELLAELKPGSRVLDLGTGNGIVARRLAVSPLVWGGEDGGLVGWAGTVGGGNSVSVLGTDYSPAQLEHARQRTAKWWAAIGKGCPDDEIKISFEELDLLNCEALDEFAQKHAGEFDVITASMLLKELCDLRPLAAFLPKVLKKGGKVIMANLHPCFHKPGAHRVIEVLENPQTGQQEIHHSIKVSKYLDIKPVQSQALRGQPEPLVWFHRPIEGLLRPFFDNGFVMDRLVEPAFSSPKWVSAPGPDTLPNSERNKKPEEIHSYEKFEQIPMQFIFRLVHP